MTVLSQRTGSLITQQGWLLGDRKYKGKIKQKKKVNCKREQKIMLHSFSHLTQMVHKLCWIDYG